MIDNITINDLREAYASLTIRQQLQYKRFRYLVSHKNEAKTDRERIFLKEDYPAIRYSAANHSDTSEQCENGVELRMMRLAKKEVK